MASKIAAFKFTLTMLGCLLLVLAKPLGAAERQQIMWDDLIPPGWNPEKVFQDMDDEAFNALPEETYQAMLKQVQTELDAAPVVDKFDGADVKIPGFIVPLEISNASISEFLLVPYYGACTHTPPPPANQIIFSRAENEFTVDDIYQPVWITGKLKTERYTSKLNEAGVAQAADVYSSYSMDVEKVEPYTE